MKFNLRVNDQVKEDFVDVVCNKRNYATIKDLLSKVKELDNCLSLYDDEHNMYRIHIMQIYYFEYVDNKVFAYTKNETYRTSLSLSKLKTELKKYGIRQINKNTLINIHHIQSVKVACDCRRIIQLDNLETLIANRQYRNFLDE